MNPFRLELSSTTRVDAQPSEVWAVFADVSRWTEWCNVCVKAEVDPDFDWSAGQQLRLKFRMAGLPVPFNVRIENSEPRRIVSWASTKFTVTAVRTFTFESDPTGGTRATDHKLFTSPVLPLRLFYPRPLIRSMTESMLSDLKIRTEQVAPR